jgi:hypothetical protein
MNLPVKTESPALVDTSAIPGWGVDADPRNDPTYPMRDQAGDHGLTRHWNRPSIQEPQVEILQSIEHIRRPAVIGTSTPPSGVSGLLRRAAFRWSESHWLHWLMLMGADRINVIEGVIDDLAHARIPNVPREMGIRSELQFNKRNLVSKVAVGGALSAAALVLIWRSKRSKRGEASADLGAQQTE